MKHLNNFKSSLKFTFECDGYSVNFLHLNVKLDNVELTPSVYIKYTDRHQYLNYSSSHPDHIKRQIIYSQILWASCLCSFKENCEDHFQKMKLCFRNKATLTRLFKMK